MLRAWVADDSFRKFKLIINGIEDLGLYGTSTCTVVQLDISKVFFVTFIRFALKKITVKRGFRQNLCNLIIFCVLMHYQR